MVVNKELLEEIKNCFLKSKGSHDFEHTKRVYNLCMHIGKIEKGNLNVLKIAALMHDIARNKEDKVKGKICHAEYGAKLAKKILKKYNFNEKIINEVIHCIKSHRFRGENKPKTLEAKILFDSDKLDSIGAVGIGRAFLFAGEVNAKLHDKNVDIKNTKSYTKEDTAYREYLVKLKKIKNKMLTKEGKRIAKSRDKFMKEFFDRLNKEVDGLV
ncbi:MAG: HD domain-containing protein [Nanoarchaeota archaeon]